jgi:hypothetical protein
MEALACLSKPFAAERFHTVVDRALRTHSQSPFGPSAASAKVEHLLAQLAANQPTNQRILVRNQGPPVL